MGHMATLDGTVAGPWAGVGRDQLDWLQGVLADWDKGKHVAVLRRSSRSTSTIRLGISRQAGATCMRC